MNIYSQNESTSYTLYIKAIGNSQSVLSTQHTETVIDAFISSHLNYCTSLYVGVSQSLLSHLQLHD